MTVPRADSTLAARVKKLEEEFRRIKLMPSTTQTDVAPAAAVKGAVWIDSSAGNEPKVWDGTAWVPVRDETIAVAQSTADTAQATVDPLVPLTDLAGVTDGLTITGATNETDEPGTGPRVVINDPAYPGEIVLYTDDPSELEPARVRPIVNAGAAYLQLVSPKTTVGDAPTTVNLNSDDGVSSFEVDADQQHLYATNMTIDGFTLLKLGDGTDYISIAGQTVTDADLSDPSNIFPATPWVSYTSTMASSGGGLVATTTARYRDIGNKREVEIRSTITTLGAAGVYNWSLPSTPVSPTASWDPLGTATVVDVSANIRAGLVAFYSGGSSVSMAGDTGARVSNTSPFAAAVGDTYSIKVSYEWQT